MKKIIALLLIAVTLLSLVACGESFYEPVESTQEEARVVMNISYGGRTYEVKYELYRALFLNFKSTVDGGDNRVWSGEDKDKYIKEIENIIISYAIDIYSTFALAYDIGIDPYSADVGKKVNHYINVSVGGGEINGTVYEGYESYEDYLANLKEMNLNYSVQSLMFRYAVVLDMVEEYYMGTITDEDIGSGIVAGGKLEYDEQTVRDFYYSDECVRVLRTYVTSEMSSDPTRPEKVRDAIALAAEGGDEETVRSAMIANGALVPVPEMENGYVIGRHNLDSAYYGDMVDAAFALNEGEVSEVITVHDGNQYVHYIIYRAEKSDAHFEANYASITYIYLRNSVGEYLDDIADAMLKNVTGTNVLSSLDHSKISMD